MVCLDSDILIDFLGNKKEAVQIINKLRSSEAEMAITAVNSFEILCGKDSLDKNKLEKIEEFLSSFKIYDFDFSSSQKASVIFRYLKGEGAMIDLGDIMIASICISNNESFMTRNAKHFSRIPELKIEGL